MSIDRHPTLCRSLADLGAAVGRVKPANTQLPFSLFGAFYPPYGPAIAQHQDGRA